MYHCSRCKCAKSDYRSYCSDCNKEYAKHKKNFPREGKASAKLTRDNVLQIRQMILTHPVKYVAQLFGVVPETIYNIKEGFTWKHV